MREKDGRRWRIAAVAIVVAVWMNVLLVPSTRGGPSSRASTTANVQTVGTHAMSQTTQGETISRPIPPGLKAESEKVFASGLRYFIWREGKEPVGETFEFQYALNPRMTPVAFGTWFSKQMNYEYDAMGNQIGKGTVKLYLINKTDTADMPQAISNELKADMRTQK